MPRPMTTTERQPLLSRRALLALLPLLALTAIALWRFGAVPHEPLGIPEDLAGDPQAVGGPWPMAVAALERGDHAEATRHLEAYLEDDPRNPEALFRLALCHLETGRDAEAAGLLETLRLNEPELYPDATWYLALAEIKLGRSGGARQLLEELEQGPDAFYREKARVFRETFL